MTAPVYGLTPAQADCARVIHALTDFLGNSPRFAEIGVELDMGVSNIHRLVHCLVQRGWLEPYAPQIKRALRLTRSPPSFNGNPITITEAGLEYLEAAA